MVKHHAPTVRGIATLLLLVAPFLAACNRNPSGPAESGRTTNTAKNDGLTFPTSVQPPASPTDPACATLSGTVYGKFVTTPEEAWVGTALLSINGADPESATFVDRNTSANVNALLAGKPFQGTEILTLTFADGSTFDVDAQFVGVPASTPYLYNLNETGHITNGTGRFAGISGDVSTHGPFLSPLFVDEPPWVAASTGTVCGI